MVTDCAGRGTLRVTQGSERTFTNVGAWRAIAKPARETSQQRGGARSRAARTCLGKFVGATPLERDRSSVGQATVVVGVPVRVRSSRRHDVASLERKTFGQGRSSSRFDDSEPSGDAAA